MTCERKNYSIHQDITWQFQLRCKSGQEVTLKPCSVERFSIISANQVKSFVFENIYFLRVYIFALESGGPVQTTKWGGVDGFDEKVDEGVQAKTNCHTSYLTH